MGLPLRHQGVLVSAIRGCDEGPKRPYDSSHRELSSYLRFVVLNPADEREVGVPGAFISPNEPFDWKASDFGHLPQHWYAHIMHAYEIVGYKHPNRKIASGGMLIYCQLVENLHLHIETEAEMDQRLTEDRFVSGTIVS